MTKSESIVNISKALSLFRVKIEKIKKGQTNPFYKSTYAGLPDILDAIDLPLAESGLIFSQHPDGINGLTTILIHAETGEYFESTYTMPVTKPNDPQAVGSAITYARRYALGAILGLNTEEDDDGNKASQKPADKPANEKPWLNQNTDQWKQAVIALRSGTVTMDKIKNKYAISKPNQDLLLSESNTPA